MSSVKITKDEYDADNTPKNESGDEFSYVMVGADDIIFSDGFGDLTAVFFDDGSYPDLTPEEQLEKRHDLAVAIATSVQGGVVSALTDAGTLDTSALTEPEINLVFNSKDNAYEHEGDWSASATDGTVITLPLVATMYSPFTEVPRVTGEDVVYLDPTTEENFVRSLNDLGVVDLHILP